MTDKVQNKTLKVRLNKIKISKIKVHKEKT